MLTLISSCATTDSQVIAAATVKGRADAKVKLGDLPADCLKREPHADVKTGDEFRAVLVRERGATDRANDRVTRCAGFYNDQKHRLEN
jgi:ribosomal protein L14